MSMTWPRRMENFEHVMHQPSYMWTQGEWAMGMWFVGKSYQKKNTYYGGYQGNYLKRIAALFPDKQHALHLFSGMVDLTLLSGDTVDINRDLHPTYVDDAQTLLNVPLETYDLVVADPPYSEQDAVHYGTTMIDRNRVMKALQRLPVGAHVVWLDQVSPMYSKEAFHKQAVIGLIGSTNARYRVITIWQRLPHPNGGDA